MSNIVITGGGTGMSIVLKSLKPYNHNLTALIPMIANGGSTGRLRLDLDVSPVGHIRNAILALANTDSITLKTAKYRYTKGELKGHNFGNIYLAALEKVTGDLEIAIELLQKQLNVKGEIIPITKEFTDICIELENGELICGEQNLDNINSNYNFKIKDLFLEPPAKLNRKAKQKILNADFIILGPGDLYYITSIFLIEDFIKIFKQSKAKLIFICNITNKLGGITTNFSLYDYIQQIEKYLGKDSIDFIIYNTKKPTKKLLELCIKNNETLVKYDKNLKQLKKYKIIKEDLLSNKVYKKIKSDIVCRSILRHSPKKLGNVLNKIINSKI